MSKSLDTLLSLASKDSLLHQLKPVEKASKGVDALLEDRICTLSGLEQRGDGWYKGDDKLTDYSFDRDFGRALAHGDGCVQANLRMEGDGSHWFKTVVYDPKQDKLLETTGSAEKASSLVESLTAGFKEHYDAHIVDDELEGESEKSVATKTKPDLWKRIVASVKAGAKGGDAGEWSARKAQLAVLKYKQAGGGYSGAKSESNSLKKWTKEDWKTDSGEPSDGKKRYLPAAAWEKLTPAERRATNAAKRKGDKDGKQFVGQPDAAKKAGRTAREKALQDLRLEQRRAAVESYKAWAVREKAVDELDARQQKIAGNWDRLVNMSGSSVMAYAASGLGKKSGLSRGEAGKQGITSGRERPRQIARLKGMPKSKWTDADWSIAARVTSFISRMLGAKGPMYDDKGRPTRKLMSLKIWGHSVKAITDGIEVERAIKPLIEDMQMSMTPVTFEKAIAPLETIYRQFGDELANILRDNKVDLSKYKRVLKITPSIEKADLQQQIIALDALRKSWDFYAAYGNVDLNHQASPTRDEAKAKEKMIASGYPYHPTVGKMAMEVGRPIPGTFNTKDCSFLAYIYCDDEPQPEERLKAAREEKKLNLEPAYEFFWKSIKAGRVWKASVGGMATAPRPAVIQQVDERLGINQKAVVGLLSDYVWHNTACCEFPVQSWVPPMEIVKDGDRIVA